MGSILYGEVMANGSIRLGGEVLAPLMSLNSYQNRKGVDNEPNIEIE